LITQEFKNVLPSDFFEVNSGKSILGLSTQELKREEIQYVSTIFQNISYTHFTELIKIDDATKRRFYELLILKTQPSVKELKRQIDSLTFERVGLSVNQNTSFNEVLNKIMPQQATDLVKSHYFFEFLNLGQPHLIEETKLEQDLVSHLQQFITELGNGFCFEARQKRILIGDEYYFIDLVFYHRILKCHVIVELKTENAKHEHIGQLKSYLQHYKKNIQEENDNPPVGILLVTNQNKTLVEYAIADSDLDIFVSKYQLQLPDKAKLEAFINNELKNTK
jgi:predicted nuclease of restriction endonuclease-like (RecB) superfamily